MRKVGKRAGKENAIEGLSSRIERTFINVLKRALVIICLESLVISGVLAVMYSVKDNRSDATAYTDQIDLTMQSKVSMLEAIAAGVSSGTLHEQDAILDYVDSMVSMDEQISAVYSCYDENVTIMSGGWQPPEDFVVTEREWYKGAQANPEEVYISDPYADKQTGNICITLSKATYRDGKVAGVVGMDMYMDDLVSLIEESFSSSGYVFLTTAGGTILVHPNEDYSISVDHSFGVQDVNAGRYERFLKGAMATGLFLDYKGGFKLGIGNISDVTGWRVISVKTLYSMFFFFVLIIVLNLSIYIIMTGVARKNVNKRVSVLFRPLESISAKMGRVADGDLSVVFDEEKNSLEIARLTEAINEMIERLKFYIDSISSTVTAISNKNLTITIDGEFKGSYMQIRDALESIISSLNESFRQISREAQNVLEFADKLEKTTEGVAQSATMQNELVANVSEDMVHLTEQTKQITERAVLVRDSAETTKRHLETGNCEMEKLVKAMESIDQCYREIAEFVGEIQNIASQTNLLSLNASIEAARAGEAGRGFAVVAGEISTLAESSERASKNINKLIEESTAAVCSGKELVESTSKTILQGMNDSVQSKQHVDDIVEFVEKQQRAIENVNQELKEVAGIVENNAASAQENTAISQELNECAQSLKQMADSFALR